MYSIRPDADSWSDGTVVKCNMTVLSMTVTESRVNSVLFSQVITVDPK